jgi:hypothetical protein
MSEESVPGNPSEIVYYNISREFAGNTGLKLDTTYNGTRLKSANLLVDNITSLIGKVGISTGTPRQALEVTGNTILTAQGSASQGVREFGLNGSYDTLSLVSPVGLGLNGTTSIFFGLNSLIYYPVARIVAVDNGNYSGSLAFQIGNGSSLYQQMRLTMNGIITAGAAFLYTTKTLPTPGTNLCLNFPSVNNSSTSVIDVYVTLQRKNDTSVINMVKFTVFLGTELYVTSVSVQSNGITPLFINRNGIKANGSKVTISYTDMMNEYLATVNYMAYGPATAFIQSIDITLNDSGRITAPGVPTGYSAIPGNMSVILNWSAPPDGGSVITGYTISNGSGMSVNDNGTLTSDSLMARLITNETVLGNTAVTITGLINGTSYTFTIKAKNAIGYSGTSTVSVTPAIAPGVPTPVTAVAGNGSATVSWTAPSNNGGSPIISYTITYNNGADSLTVTNGTSSVIPGLTNGTPYTFTVYATNIIGPSLGALSSPVTPKTVPDAPTIPTVTAVIGTTTVTWTAPASNGSPITGYKVSYSNDDGNNYTQRTYSGTSTSATLTGLTPGASYIFKVLATNAAGDSLSSPISSSTLIPELPGVPIDLTSVSGDKTAILSWVTPTSTSGLTILGYKVYNAEGLIYNSTTNTFITDTGSIYTTTTALTVPISLLTNGTTYTFTIKASNAFGDSTLVTFPAVTPGLPGAPLNLTAIPGNLQITLNWSAPSVNGGSAITGYKIYDSSNLTTAKYDGTDNLATTYTINGLTNGTEYTYRVFAINTIGISLVFASATTRSGLPGTPTGFTAVAANISAILSWTAPSSNGGSAILGYKVYNAAGQIYDGSNNMFITDIGVIYTTSGALILTKTLTGLVNGTQYTFTIFAVNSVGRSSIGASISITPGLPGPPTNLIAFSGNGYVTLSWSAPSNNGGATITEYRIQSNGTFINVSPTTATITGLTNGTLYTFVVNSVNATGISLGSVSTSITPFTVPGVPLNVTAESTSNNTVTLNWLAPSTGGSAILGYKVYNSTGNIYNTTTSTFVTPDTGLIYSTSGPLVLTLTISGLTAGIIYTYTIKAANLAGNSLPTSIITVITGVPGTPTSFVAVPGNASVTLNWSAPVSIGGSYITEYTVTYGVTSTKVSDSTYTTTVSGLVNGNQYTFSIVATNPSGSSLTPAMISVTPGLPNPPTGLTATAGTASATLNWIAPLVNVGNGYVITYLITTVTTTVNVTEQTTATITGLTTGTQYTFTVKSVNTNGNSVGGASISVIPA